MTDHKKPHSEKKLGFYHQNEALLFQFLLHECLLAYQKVKRNPDALLLLQVIGKSDFLSNNWCPPQGHFPRLHHYASIMMTHFTAFFSSCGPRFILTLTDAHTTAKECYRNLNDHPDLGVKLTSQLRKEIRFLIKLLFEKLPEFRENSAVLFFLLKHQEQIDSIYREPLVKNIFMDFFPEGLLQASGFLTEKFSKKGFHHLIPLIERNLKKIEGNDNSPS